MSYPEIRGHFKEILVAGGEDDQKAEVCRYYWLLPGRELSNGLSLLHDDSSCNQMEKSTVGYTVAHIFVDDEHRSEVEEIDEMHTYYTSLKCGKRSSTVKKKGKEKVQKDSDEGESSDSDYIPGDDSSSEDDDEVSEINNRYKDVKNKMKAGLLEHLDDVLIDCARVGTEKLVGDEDVSDNTSYIDSSEFDDSFDEAVSDEQIVMRPSRYRRFKKTEAKPEFSLGMKFRSKQEFRHAMIRDVKVGDGQGWVIISDQQKGILNAVKNWAPMAEHRNCAWHIYANWRKTYKKKEFQKKFWKCAKAPSVVLFNLAVAKLKQATRGGRAVLKTDPHHWSRAYFRLGSNCDSVDNNMCESFNKWIVDARFFPVISMFEAIRRKVMVRIQEQRNKSDGWPGPICPNINKKLNTYIKLSENCSAICNGEDKYEGTGVAALAGVSDVCGGRTSSGMAALAGARRWWSGSPGEEAGGTNGVQGVPIIG
ncbi:hypothetical protein QYE76_043200 [Lolium multiflorum]|uniref:Transposase n=1 Tax=Lolium multiflorum TaxID=4521 RepID=A0AAD8WVC4_LOLMU|nr:hypothetical protein QYE76_043200 [Lolium multiflorum]